MQIRISYPFCSLPLFFVTLLLATGNLFSAEYIEWEAVKGADHYRIQFRQNGINILETQSKQTKIVNELPPGEYEFRVEVVDPFGNVASSSKWSKLTILDSLNPFIINFSPQIIYENAQLTFSADVIGYQEGKKRGTEFHLENKQGRKVKLSLTEYKEEEGYSDSRINVTMKSESGLLTRGEWDFVMINPNGKDNRIVNALIVKTQKRPRIKRIKPRVISLGKVNNLIDLEIINMEEDTVLLFDGPSKITPILVDKKDETLFRYNIDLLDVEPGWYAITIKNSSGETHRKNYGLKIKKQEKELEFSIPNAIPETPPPLSKLPHSFSGGYSVNFPIGDATNHFSHALLGFSLNYSQNFYNQFIRRIVPSKGLGWEINALYANAYRTNLLVSNAQVHHMSMLLGLFYVTQFKIPLNFMFRTGFGLSYSLYNSPDVSRQKDLGTYSLEELDSIDFIWRSGIGMRVNITSQFFVDLTLDATGVFYISPLTWFLQPRAEVGIKW